MQCTGEGSVNLSQINYNNADDLESALRGRSYILSIDEICDSTGSSASSPNTPGELSPVDDEDEINPDINPPVDPSEGDIGFATAASGPSESDDEDYDYVIDGGSTSTISLENGMELVFDSTTVVLVDGSETVATGTWEAVDGDTIEIVLDGQTITTDIIVYSDGVIELGYVNDLFSTSCTGSGSNSGAVSPVDPVEDDEDDEEEPWIGIDPVGF